VQSRELAFGRPEVSAANSSGALARISRIVAFACLTAVASQLRVDLPFTPVPLTIQTLFVVLAGVVLGPRDGFYAILAYLGAGAAGAPVFAGFLAGPAVLFGPTGGYLVSFPAAALLAGFVSERLGGGRLAVFAASITGMALILASGASYLGLIAGLSLAQALSLGAAPFVAGELVKAAAAAALAGAPGRVRR
jgi:biotin transport system substrate-specific component